MVLPTSEPRSIAIAVHQAPPRLSTVDSVQAAVAAIAAFRRSLNTAAAKADETTLGNRHSDVDVPAMLLFSELFIGGYGSGFVLATEEHSIAMPPPSNTTSSITTPMGNNETSAPSSTSSTSRSSLHHPAYQGHELLEPIRDACRTHRVAVVVGHSEALRSSCLSPPSDPSPEQQQQQQRGHANAATVIDDEGMIVTTYRKVHLWGDYEQQFFSPGDDLLRGVFTFHGIRCGVLICFDVEFPEATRTLRVAGGCEVILVPTALVSAFNATVTVPSRAFENNCVVCYANEVGPDPHLSGVTYCGRSVIALPDGTDGCRLPPPSYSSASGASTTSSSATLAVTTTGWCVEVPTELSPVSTVTTTPPTSPSKGSDKAMLGITIVDLNSFEDARRRNDYLHCLRPECYRLTRPISHPTPLQTESENV